MTSAYLGIDGGGTKTKAVILDDSGRVIGSGWGESSNFGNIGVALATRHIQTAVEQAVAEAGIAAPPFAAAFLGIAGVVSQEDRNIVESIAQQLHLAPDNRIGVDHDCRAALAGGLGGEPGIVQIIGTGTSCFGLTTDGRRWMAGGWGHLIADEGGGYWMGIQAMKAAAAAYDTREQATLLLGMVMDALGISDFGQIMQRVYSQQLSVTEIAALSQLVIEAAQQGDAVARDIIAAGMGEVARCVEAVATYLDFPADMLRLVCVGGITQAGDVVMEPLRRAVYQRLPHCQIATPMFDAAVGAALLALKQHRGAIEPAVLENTKQSLCEGA